jgi:zinc protease
MENTSGRRSLVRIAPLALVAVTGLASALASPALADDKAPVKVAAAATSTLSGALPTDPRLQTGELANGLRYIVLRHSNPPGRVNIWLNISSGSMNETDPQRGIAHYLEHMAFNGSTNFPPGTVVPLFESLGLTFGRHQNAFTSFDQTTYQLSLPDTSDEKVDKALTFMSDVAFNLLLTEAEIEEERGIIMEEKRTRLGARQRVQEEFLKVLAPGSKVGDRLPIGTDETIMGVQRPDFVDYYSTWYKPSNMTLIIVADADPQAMIAKIPTYFSKGEKTPKPADLDANVSPSVGLRGSVITDAELTDASIAFVRIAPPDAPTTTYEIARARLVDGLATAAFNRRVDAKVNDGIIKSLGGGAFTGTQFGAMRISQVSWQVKPEAWQDGMREMGTEVRRAALHGFSQKELDAVKAEVLADAKRAASQESSLPARAVIAGMNNAVAQGDTITSAAQDLAMLEAFLPGISAAEVNASFATSFASDAGLFSLQGPASMQTPSNDELASMGEQAFRVSPEADAETASATSFAAPASPAASIEQASTHQASQVGSAWLSNGVRVHHRFMDIRKDQVSVSINLARGTINTLDANERAIAEAAGLAWQQPATSTLSSTNVRDIMTGKNVSVGGGVGADTMSLTISGTPADLEEGFKLAHLLLTDPKIEASALDQWKTRQLEAIAMREKDPRAAFSIAVAQTALPSDPRVQPITKEAVEAVTIEAAQAWLRTAIAKAEIEMAVVGDISEARAMQLAATYIGTTGERMRISSSTLDELRTLTRPVGPMRVDRTLATQTKQALVLGGFYTADADNVFENRAMQLASQSIDSRMTKIIRERDQLVYSISPRNAGGTTWPGMGTFAAVAPTEPSKVPALAERIEEIYTEFAKTGPTAEEMAVGQKQIANTLDESMRDPSFWLARLGTLEYRNTKLDDVMNAAEAYTAITPEMVREVFVKYYKPENFMIVTLTPAASDAPVATPAAAPAGVPASQ